MDGTDFHDYDAKSRSKKGKHHTMVSLCRKENVHLSGVTKRVHDEGHDLTKREVENYVNSIPDNMAVNVTYSFNKAKRWEKAINGRLLDDVPDDVEAEVYELLQGAGFNWKENPSTSVHCRNRDGSISSAHSKKGASHWTDLVKNARAKKTLDDGVNSTQMGPKITYEIYNYVPNSDRTRKWYNSDNTRRCRRAGAFHVDNDDLDGDYGDETDDEELPSTSMHTKEADIGTFKAPEDSETCVINRQAMKVSLEECVVPSKEKLTSDWVLVWSSEAQ